MKKFIFILVLSILTMGNSLNSGTTNQIWTAPDKSIAKKLNNDNPLWFVDPKQKECLSLNIYFEAAVESTAGKLAVAQVTLNRVKSEQYPETICKVVYEGSHFASGHPKRDMCQFSWYCDGKHDIPNEGRAWRESQNIAEYIMKTPGLLDITDHATHYHADYIPNPRWAQSRDRTVKIDTHIFYHKKNNFNF